MPERLRVAVVTAFPADPVGPHGDSETRARTSYAQGRCLFGSDRWAGGTKAMVLWSG